MTTAGIIRLAVVTRWEKRRPELVDVAWLAMRVHVGRVRSRGAGLTSLTSRGRITPPPGSGKLLPPSPKGTQVPPPPPPWPRVQAPAWSGRHVTGRGWLDERVEQQQRHQRATWEVGAISAEAAERDLQACLD